jgi:hypothetical protein
VDETFVQPHSHFEYTAFSATQIVIGIEIKKIQKLRDFKITRKLLQMAKSKSRKRDY